MLFYRFTRINNTPIYISPTTSSYFIVLLAAPISKICQNVLFCISWTTFQGVLNIVHYLIIISISRWEIFLTKRKNYYSVHFMLSACPVFQFLLISWQFLIYNLSHIFFFVMWFEIIFAQIKANVTFMSPVLWQNVNWSWALNTTVNFPVF